MRLDASYDLCSKLGSKLIFCGNYGSFRFARPFYNFECIFQRDLFLKVAPDKIYAYRPIRVGPVFIFFFKVLFVCFYFLRYFLRFRLHPQLR